jgi:methylmalonyl-CoA mutase
MQADEIAKVFPPASREAWLHKVDAVLKGAEFRRRLVSRTADGIEIEPLYGRAAAARPVVAARGASRWRTVARVDHPVPAEAAALARADVEGGADDLCLVPAASRQARGHGLSFESLAEIDTALEGVALERTGLRLAPSPGGRRTAALVAALVKARGHLASEARIHFGMDPLGCFATAGNLAATWPEVGARLAESAGTLAASGFSGPFALADARPYHEAGAGEAMELAACVGTALAYWRALAGTGADLGAARRMLSFAVAVDQDQFMGIAKLRALRLLWARVEEVTGVAPEPILIHAGTSFRMLTRRDAHTNILRAAIAAFAAAAGGADSIEVSPFTAPLGLPDAAARRLARNTSLVLMEESSLWRVADPAAGSGAFEALTRALCEKAWDIFRSHEQAGGIPQALADGLVQREIAEQRAARARAFATRREGLTGTSEFADLAERPPAVLSAMPPVPDGSRGRTGDPFRPFAGLVADFAGGTLRHALEPPPAAVLSAEPLPEIRWSEPFEALRDRADAIAARAGRPPAVTLLILDDAPRHGARLMFTRNLFAAGGIHADPVAAGEAVPAGGLVCLVGADETYAEKAVAAASALAGQAGAIWLAGRPGDLGPALAEAGVSRFLFVGCDVTEALAAALDRLEGM